MGKKVLFRTIGALLLITALLVTQIPAKEVNADNSKKTEFQLDGDTLVKYTGTATTVSVPSGVKVIGEEAFLNNTNLVSLKLPASLEKISYASFSGCTGLKELDINDKCEEIESAAFANCSNLKKVSLGTGIKKLGSGVFVGCRKITNFKIKSDKYLITKKNIIYNKDKTKLVEAIYTPEVTSVDIPNSVTYIHPYAFYGCNNIKDLTLSTNLEEIQAYSFSNCYGITDITIPYSVDNIDAKAFENCINLDNVTIPESVSFIHDTAFDGCPKLSVDAPTWSYAYKWFQNFQPSDASIIDYEDNDIPLEFENKEEGTVSGNDYTVKEDGLSQTKVVGRNAVFFIDNTALTVSEKKEKEAEIEEDYSEDDSNGTLDVSTINLIPGKIDNKGAYIPKFAIVDDRIAAKAFYGDSSIKEYVVPSNITSVGDFSFARSSVEKIVLPDGLESIGFGAFYHCDELLEIDIPLSVKEIAPSAFEYTKFMQNWVNNSDSDFLIVGDGILLAYKGRSENVEIPDNVRIIGSGAFKNNKNIHKLVIGDSVEIIGEDAFGGCSNLNIVQGGKNIKEIKDRGFDSCPIETITVSDSVLNIGLGAFDLNSSDIEMNSKVVVFEGSVLPIVTNEKTSSRLTNSHYRVDALNGVNLAIVENEDVNILNSVLDSKNAGFSGLIGIISQHADSDAIGSIKIIDCTLDSVEAANFEIPTYYNIYGKRYSVDYDEVSTVIDFAKSGINDSKKSSNVKKFDGDDSGYILSVKKCESIDLNDAYERVYATPLPDNADIYDVSLRAEDTNVEITKLGRQSLEVAIKLEDDLTKDNLHIIALDNDKQLEEISYNLSEGSSSVYVFFDITHTGIYGIYSGQTSSLLPGELDLSPDTGDYVHPKWFLAIGLLLASLAMFMIRVK